MEKIKNESHFKGYIPVSKPDTIRNDRSRYILMKCLKRLLILTGFIDVDKIIDIAQRFNEIEIYCIETFGELKAYFGKRFEDVLEQSQFKVRSSLQPLNLWKKKVKNEAPVIISQSKIIKYYQYLLSKLK